MQCKGPRLPILVYRLTIPCAEVLLGKMDCRAEPLPGATLHKTSSAASLLDWRDSYGLPAIASPSTDATVASASTDAVVVLGSAVSTL